MFFLSLSLSLSLALSLLRWLWRVAGERWNDRLPIRCQRETLQLAKAHGTKSHSIQSSSQQSFWTDVRCRGSLFIKINCNVRCFIRWRNFAWKKNYKIFVVGWPIHCVEMEYANERHDGHLLLFWNSETIRIRSSMSKQGSWSLDGTTTAQKRDY